MWLHTSGFLFTWLSHALHCTKLFLYYVDNFIFKLKAIFLRQVTFLKPAAEPSVYWLMDGISGPSKMQTDLDLALAEQKIYPKPIEIILSLFFYHK